MSDTISDQLRERERSLSVANLRQLEMELLSGQRLVFFVGAGVSSAGRTAMPGVPQILEDLLVGAVQRQSISTSLEDRLTDTARGASHRLGFEITMNGLWHLSRQAVLDFFHDYEQQEVMRETNNAHKFLAHWLRIGGTVFTTNYDRFPERYLSREERERAVRFRYDDDRPDHSPQAWLKDLQRGGTIFKLHGSFDDLSSCLAAMEQVGTMLGGERRRCLREAVSKRPVCFIGWHGIDPDCPPVLKDLLDSRDPSLPVYWIHFETESPRDISLDDLLTDTSPLLRSYASAAPIVSDADRLGIRFLELFGEKTEPTTGNVSPHINFGSCIAKCSRSGSARFAGTALRRAHEFDAAVQLLEIAERDESATPEERQAAYQETTLTLWSRGAGVDQVQALRRAEKAAEDLDHSSDIHMRLNADFGVMSMTFVVSKRRPWLAFRLPTMVGRYRGDIARLRELGTDGKTVALHEALLALYIGRFRARVLLPIFRRARFVRRWALVPFEESVKWISEAGDIDIHSSLDIRAGYAHALAQAGESHEAENQLEEAERLSGLLKDEARTRHWRQQRRRIERLLGTSQDSRPAEPVA